MPIFCKANTISTENRHRNRIRCNSSSQHTHWKLWIFIYLLKKKNTIWSSIYSFIVTWQVHICLYDLCKQGAINHIILPCSQSKPLHNYNYENFSNFLHINRTVYSFACALSLNSKVTILKMICSEGVINIPKLRRSLNFRRLVMGEISRL